MSCFVQGGVAFEGLGGFVADVMFVKGIFFKFIFRRKFWDKDMRGEWMVL